MVTRLQNQIMLVDGAREVLGFSLNSLGYSLNTKNMTELRLAETKLNSLTPNIKAIVGDEMKGYMVQGDAAIGVTFSGEASEMLDKNEDLRYVVPSEGSNLWFDNLVIPKTVKHEKRLMPLSISCLNQKMQPKMLSISVMPHLTKQLKPCFQRVLPMIKHFIHLNQPLKILKSIII